MFPFIKPAEIDHQKVHAFVTWFCANEERIRRSVDNKDADRDMMMRVLDEVEAQLALVYRDGYKGSIEFDYGGQDMDWELNLYHMRNKFLIKATGMIADAFEAVQLPAWKINVDE